MFTMHAVEVPKLVCFTYMATAKGKVTLMNGKDHDVYDVSKPLPKITGKMFLRRSGGTHVFVELQCDGNQNRARRTDHLR